jgi:hypothetical protein
MTPSSPPPDQHDGRGEHYTPPSQHPYQHRRADDDGHADREAHAQKLLAASAENRGRATIDAGSLLN